MKQFAPKQPKREEEPPVRRSANAFGDFDDGFAPAQHRDKRVQAKQEALQRAIDAQNAKRPQPSEKSEEFRQMAQRFSENSVAGRINKSIQAKLTIGQPDDKYEKDADSTAEIVMSKPNPEPSKMPRIMNLGGLNNPIADISKKEMLQMLFAPDHATFETLRKEAIQRQALLGNVAAQKEIDVANNGVVQPSLAAPSSAPARRTDEEEAKKAVQKMEENTVQGKAIARMSDVEAKLNASRGGGQPMPEELRIEMETRFGGLDFSQVRIHTDSAAQRMCTELHARAFTSGRDIYFNAGQWDPASKAGKTLLAHELTHTVHQGATAGQIQREADGDEAEVQMQAEDAEVQMQESPDVQKMNAPEVQMQAEAADVQMMVEEPGVQMMETPEIQKQEESAEVDMSGAPEVQGKEADAQRQEKGTESDQNQFTNVQAKSDATDVQMMEAHDVQEKEEKTDLQKQDEDSAVQMTVDEFVAQKMETVERPEKLEPGETAIPPTSVQTKCATCGSETTSVQSKFFDEGDDSSEKRTSPVQAKCANCAAISTKESSIQREAEFATSSDSEVQTQSLDSNSVEPPTAVQTKCSTCGNEISEVQRMEKEGDADEKQVQTKCASCGVETVQREESKPQVDASEENIQRMVETSKQKGQVEIQKQSDESLQTKDEQTIHKKAEQAQLQADVPNVQAKKSIATTAQEIIDLLSGYTSSEDSKIILNKIKWKSAEDTRELMTELKSGKYSSTSGKAMMYWLMWDLVSEDREELLDHLIWAKSDAGYKFIATTIIDEHISGYTSAADSTAIYGYFSILDVVGTDKVLRLIQSLLGKNWSETAEYLFDDLTLVDQDSLKELFYRKGTLATRYASLFTAKKIENLLRGWTGNSDSVAIVTNFKNTPTLFRVLVLARLEELSQKRWKMSAEDALMEDMNTKDYNQLVKMKLPLRPYDIQKTWLDWGWEYALNGIDNTIAGVSYIVCGFAGAIWGIIKSLVSIIGDIIQLVFVGIPNLIGWLTYIVSGGRVGRDAYNSVNEFFSGIWSFFGFGEDKMTDDLQEPRTHAELIEGPFSECKSAFHGVSNVFETIVDVLLIFIGGYGLVKGAFKSAKAIYIISKSKTWGRTLSKFLKKTAGKIKNSPKNLVAFIKLIKGPSLYLEKGRGALSRINILAADEGYWKLIRKQAGNKIANEKDFWKTYHKDWAEAAKLYEAKLTALEAKMDKAVGPSTTGDEGIILLEETAAEAKLLEAEMRLLENKIKKGEEIGGNRRINPLDGNMNCAGCAQAGDATLKGFPSSALKHGVTSTDDVLKYFNKVSWSQGNNSISITQKMASLGDGATGVIFGFRGTGKVGHFFNVVNQQGKIRFLDFQKSGSAAMSLDELSSFKDLWFIVTNN